MAHKTERPAGERGQSVNLQSKDKDFIAQTKRVYQSFSERPKTRLEVSIETGILQGNICRFVSRMRKNDQIAVVHSGPCPISKRIVEFLTTNPDLFPLVSARQQSLFNEKGERDEDE